MRYIVCRCGNNVDWVIMEPLQCLKCPLPTSLEMCIICQERRKDRLFNATQQGIVRIQDATQEMQKHIYSKFKDAIDRLMLDPQHFKNESLVWHRSCYATFTTKQKHICPLEAFAIP